MRTIQFNKKYLDREIKLLRDNKRLLIEMKPFESSMPSFISFYCTARPLVITVKNIEQLHQTRIWLKKCFGGWEDKKDIIWFSSGLMLCSFTGKTRDMRIWLETSPEDFPKELQSDKCKVTKIESRVEEQYAYICKSDDEDEK